MFFVRGVDARKAVYEALEECHAFDNYIVNKESNPAMWRSPLFLGRSSDKIRDIRDPTLQIG
jgi:hypothetical protein